MPGHLRTGHVVPVNDVEHSLLRDGVSIPETRRELYDDVAAERCGVPYIRCSPTTKDRQGASARGRRRPARPHPCRMPTPDPRCCRECRPQTQKENRVSRVTSSPRRFRAKGRSSSAGDHAEVCWRLPCTAGVERGRLPQSPRVGKGPRQSEHRHQRAQHGKTEGFDDSYITGVSEAAHALAGSS